MGNIEEQFFKVFGIEPVWKDYRCQNTTVYTEEQAKEIRKTNRNIKLVYPQITSEILLKLICIYARREVYCFPVVPANEETWTVSKIKENILEQLIYLGQYSNDKELVKDEVRTLFEEGEEC